MIQAATANSLILATLTGYIGAYHLLVHVMRRSRATDLSFGLTCLLLSAHDALGAYTYQALDPDSTLAIMIARGWLLFPPAMTLTWFVCDYTESERGRAFWTVETLLALSVGLQFVNPLHVVFRQEPIELVTTLVGGLSFTQFRAAPGPLYALVLACLGISVAYWFTLAWRQYERGEGRLAIPLLFALTIVVAVVVQSLAIDFHLIEGIYLIHYALAGLAIVMALSLSRELVEKASVEAELAASQEKLEITLNSIGEAVVATDAKARIVRMNPEAERLSGWSLDEAIGKRFGAVFVLHDEESNEPTSTTVSGVLKADRMDPRGQRSAMIRRDGERRLVTETGAPLVDRDGRMVGTVVVMRDVTEQAKVEDRLRHAHRMEGIGQLAGGVAHDFNNMLAGVMGYASILETKLDSQPKLLVYAKGIMDAARRAAELTANLLTFSRKGRKLSEVVNVHDVVHEASHLLSRTIDKQINIEHRLSSARPLVIGDPAQLQTAILNLGVNARDAMPEGGELTISTQQVELDSAFCRDQGCEQGPGPYLEVSVVDTGMGMEKSVMDHIFEPFFTTKPKGAGTGLGLPAVYGMAKEHGGTVLVQSESGVGAAFKLYLPSYEGRMRESTPTVETIPLGEGTVLLVDDESVMRSMGKSALESLGYRVLVAEHGAKAVEIYERKGEAISLVVLDCVMPVMNGPETFTRLREIDPDVKVIVSSGFSQKGAVESMMDGGANAFLPKPYGVHEIGSLILEVLGGR